MSEALYTNCGQGLAPNDSNAPKDRTFLAYSKQHAQTYNKDRPGANPAFFHVLLEQHLAAGGQLRRLVDIGCGPGTSTRFLARTFAESIGVDASPEMVSVARETEDDAELGCAAQGRARIRFEHARAEVFDQVLAIEPGSVDLITVGQAVHWFDLPEFYTTCARVLAPGGTIAIWTYASFFAHPETPNYEAVQAALLRLEYDALGPYTTPGNVLVRDAYDNLPLPWTVTPPVAGFAATDFRRRDWNRGGVVAPGEDFFCFASKAAPEQLAAAFETASQVTRWREHHPDKARTAEDPVVSTFAEVRRLIGEQKTLRSGCSTHLLLIKKQ